MSYSMPPDPHAGARAGLRYRRGRVLVPTLVILGVLAVLFLAFTGFYTQLLWYRSIHMTSVFTHALVTRAVLFAVCGVVLGGTVAANTVVAYRARPPYSPMSPEQQNLDRYRMGIEPFRRVLTIGVSLLLGLLAGSSGAAEWKTYLLWRNGGSFGVKDPQFHRDIGFFTFDLPWYRFVVDFGFVTLTLAILAAVLTHYLYGGVRLQGTGDRTSVAARIHLSVLLGCFVLLKALAYLLDRYELAVHPGKIGRADFTGLSYTDINAVLPAKTILFWISLICAVLFFVNIVRRTWVLPGLGLGLLVISAVLIGGIVPALYQQIRVKPSIAEREAPQITKNIANTQKAYGLDDVERQTYTGDAATPNSSFVNTSTVRNIRLVDPTVVNPVVTNVQRKKFFYDFPDPLDVDRYKIDGQERDTVVAVRELDLSGVPAQQSNWINNKTAYTHGYGFLAAFGNETASSGEPVYVDQEAAGSPLTVTQPRVYFGEKSPVYSIVGAPKGTTPVEFDGLEATNGGEQNFTYDGQGGVKIGSFVRRTMYAAKYRNVNLLLSNRVNKESRILDDRRPRERVEKAAPWLKVDGDPYPAVVSGRIVWIVDGYTTSDGYPYSTRTTLGEATTDALTATASVAAQRNDEVNYIRNSVKATVDAYDGTVTLYAWDPADPVLKAWSKAFPGTVTSRDAMSPDLMAHIRYPEDLFKVQRELYSRYHIDARNAQSFFSGSDYWRVPKEPGVPGAEAEDQPPYYYTLQVPGSDRPGFALNTTFIFAGDNPNLAAFMSVDSDATSPNYGKLHVLELKAQTVKGPGLVQNLFTANDQVASLINILRTSGSTRVTFGNLLTLPVGGGFLFVEPVYVRSNGGSGNPLLQKVLVGFGDKVAFKNTLPEALTALLASDGSATTGGTPPVDTGDGTVTTGAGKPSPALATALAQAQQALNDSQKALAQTPQDWSAYGDAQRRLSAAITRALALGGSSTGGAAAAPAATATSVPSPAATAG